MVYGRTILHGGEDLTKALQRASNGAWSWEQAELGKQQMGFLASQSRPAATSVEARVDAILRPALASFLRDVRQTLSSFAAKDKAPVEEILLAGGGARVGNFAAFLADELGVPVRPLIAPPAPPEGLEGQPLADEREAPEADRFVLAQAIAATGALGHKELDLRRGEFQYRASFSILRQRAWHLVVLAAVLIACVGIHATISLRRLSAEQAVLKTQFDSASKELFGPTKMEPADVSAALRRSFKDEMVALPKATAYDLLGRHLDARAGRGQGPDQHRRSRHPAQEDHHEGHHRLGRGGRRDRGQAQGDRVLRRDQQGARQRGRGRRQAVQPDHRLQVPVRKPCDS